jgi:hypothetical protein
MSNPPTLLRIPARHTPHQTDPRNAAEFYATLGQFTVAWGRFEGHMIGALLMILNLPEASGRALPEPWKQRQQLWEAAFKEFSCLEPYKDRALAFMKRTMDEVEDRHFAAHAIWDNFVPTASEPTIRVRRIKLRGKTIIDVIDSEISITLIQRALAEVNRLNGQLLEFTAFLSSLQPPPSNICAL